jgi:4'-phosphopantetheinyl transferase
MRQFLNISDSSFKIPESLALPEDEVQLWRIDLEALRHDESRWNRLLSSDELKRASRFHFPRDRQHFAASRALLRTILAVYLKTDPGSLTFSYSKKDKPSLGMPHASAGIAFNISHSGAIALFAFARNRDIGVDVEHLRLDFDAEAIARRFFSAHEQIELAAVDKEHRVEAFFRCWTRKEAYIKATGDGLSLPLTQFDVSLASGDTNALIATRPDNSEAAHWLLQEVPAGPQYIAALCVRGRDWKLSSWPEE